MECKRRLKGGGEIVFVRDMSSRTEFPFGRLLGMGQPLGQFWPVGTVAPHIGRLEAHVFTPSSSASCGIGGVGKAGSMGRSAGSMGQQSWINAIKGVSCTCRDMMEDREIQRVVINTCGGSNGD